MKITNGSPRIALVLPPRLWASNRLPLGLMSISRFLTEQGYENLIIDNKLDSSFMPRKVDKDLELYEDMIVDTVKDYPIVGLTCMIMVQDSVIRITRKIKEISPQTYVVIGGAQPTLFPDIFLNNGADFVVRGEGERTIFDLVRAILNKGDFSQVKGISWKENGIVRHNPIREFLNPNDIPVPAFEKVNMEHYLQLSGSIIRGVPLRGVMVMASRGCPYACSYCANEKLTGRRVRFRNRESIFKEIKLLKEKYSAEGVWFADDTLTVNKKHIDSICSIMKELDMVWGGQARVDTVSEEMLKKMKKSGCIQLDLGVESGSDRILRDIANKGTNVEMAKDALRVCRKVGIRTLVNLMIGFPTETRNEMQETLSLGLELNSDEYFVSILAPLPGTKIWDMVGLNIPPEEFHKVVFHGSELTNFYNKSEVKDIIGLRLELSMKLFFASRFKKLRHYITFIKMIRELSSVPLRERLLLDFKNNFKRIKTLIVGKIELNKDSLVYKCYILLKRLRASA